MSHQNQFSHQAFIVSLIFFLLFTLILSYQSKALALNTSSETAVSSTPELLLDINTTPTGSDPQTAVTIGSQFLFFADDNIHGNELWVSDGTVEGTQFLYDLRPGFEGVEPTHLTVLNETLYFVIDDGTEIGLWRSDGTESGTALVYPFSFLSFQGGIDEIATHNNQLFISVNYYIETGADNTGLWVSDGTQDGTMLVKYFPTAQRPQYLTSMGGLLYFYAEDDQQNEGLWQSDGTTNGTILIDSFDYIGEMTSSNNLLYIVGTKANTFGLWKSNGSANNTSILIAQDNTDNTPYPIDLKTSNNMVFFSSITYGYERVSLWRSDGSVEGTIELKDTSLSPVLIRGVTHDENFYFMARSEQGTGLWKSDGTILGTIPVKDDLVDETIYPWLFSRITVFSDSLYYSGSLSESTYGIWKSDGSTAGTILIASFENLPLILAHQSGETFFAGEDIAHGRELWKTDGTASGTDFFKEINLGTDSSEPEHLTNFRGQLLFHTDKADTEYYGQPDGTIWLSDGTITNTVPFTHTLFYSRYGQPGFQLISDRFMYADGTALWSSNGVETTFNTDFSIYGIVEMLEINGMMFLIVDKGDRLPAYSIWKTDPTLENIELLRDYGYTGTGGTVIRSLTNHNGSLYFLEYDWPSVGLWQSDGTPAGTSLIATIPDMSIVDMPNNEMMFLNKTLYFILDNDEENSIELWQSDDTESGTFFLMTLVEECDFAQLIDHSIVNNRLFFHTQACETHQLWTIQGSNNIVLLGTFENITEIENGGTGLFFTADDGVNGKELWITNGTVAGTQLIKDIYPGASSSSPSSLFFYPGTGYLYFSADDGINGAELWHSDGSSANTVLLADINPGIGQSTPTLFVYIRPNLYFSANHSDFGQEVWKMHLPANEELFMPLIFLQD